MGRTEMDAMLERHDTVGSVVVCADQGNHVIQNIGNGVALNIRYSFARGGNDGLRCIPQVLQTGRVTLVEKLGDYAEEHEVVFDYTYSVPHRHARM